MTALEIILNHDYEKMNHKEVLKHMILADPELFVRVFVGSQKSKEYDEQEKYVRIVIASGLISAIKEYRFQHDSSLVEAKKKIEEYIDNARLVSTQNGWKRS